MGSAINLNIVTVIFILLPTKRKTNNTRKLDQFETHITKKYQPY